MTRCDAAWGSMGRCVCVWGGGVKRWAAGWVAFSGDGASHAAVLSFFLLFLFSRLPQETWAQAMTSQLVANVYADIARGWEYTNWYELALVKLAMGADWLPQSSSQITNQLTYARLLSEAVKRLDSTDPEFLARVAAVAVLDGYSAPIDGQLPAWTVPTAQAAQLDRILLALHNRIRIQVR